MKPVRLDIAPGITPSSDATEVSSVHWVDGDRIRFNNVNNMPEQIGGWEEIQLSTSIQGCPRSIFGYQTGSNQYLIIGTHSKLYAYLRGTVTNITPLQTTGVTLGTDPITTVNTEAGITVAHTAHGFAVGDRVKISGSAAVNGITAAQINTEFIIQTVPDANSYTVTTAGTATSSGTGGGSSVEDYAEIADGNCDAAYGFGYGGGKYGVGKYGVGKTFGTLLGKPRIWSFDLFGTTLVMTPGNGGKLYQWDGDTATAPTVVTNAPTQCNYVFVTKNICVVLGADNVGNRIETSDQANLTTWTATAANKVFEDDIENARDFICHAPLETMDVLFTDSQMYALRYRDDDLVFDIAPISQDVGIVGQNARAVRKNMIYWMSQNNFHSYNGGTIATLTGNTEGGYHPMRKYVFGNSDSPNVDENVNITQISKALCRVDISTDDVYFYYASEGSTEIDRYVMTSPTHGWWSYGSLERTAVEFPRKLFTYPVLADSSGTLYRHEKGLDAAGSAMGAYCETNYGMLGDGEYTVELNGLIPDFVQTGSAQATLYTKLYPQSASETTHGPYALTPTTERVHFTATAGVRKWRFSSSGTGTFFHMGRLRELVQPGGEL